MSEKLAGPVDPPDVETTEKEEARELRANLPATYIDTWTTLTWKGHIRIVLGETLYRRDQYRAAFVMELGEAEQFARHLLRAVDRRKAKDAAAEIKDVDAAGEA